MESNPEKVQKHFAIVVAGGEGKRMAAGQVKQFMLLWDKPVLMHTLINFTQSSIEPEIILVLPADQINTWELLCQTYSFHDPHLICKGGASRAESVLNGLKFLDENFPDWSEDALVAIHDGVRPLAPAHFIDSLYQSARESGNAIPVLPCRDTVREIGEKTKPAKGSTESVQYTTSRTINRKSLRMVQTPQVFTLGTLFACYKKLEGAGEFAQFTDDASVIEACGLEVHLAEGNFENIKITYPDDLLIAQALMGRK